MNLIVSKKFILITFLANFCWGGIEVPRNECVWLNGHYVSLPSTGRVDSLVGTVLP